MMIKIPDVIGLLGVIITILAYFLLSIQKLKPRTFAYPSMNAFGSALILFSLFFKWNISAFMMEFIWLLISLYGLLLYFLRQHRK